MIPSRTSSIFAFLLLSFPAAAVAQNPPRPPTPTRDPHTAGYVKAKDLPDGTLPSPKQNGNFIVGPTHAAAPEMSGTGDTLKNGKVVEFTMESKDSKIYPGIMREGAPRPDPADPTKLIIDSHPAPYTRKVAVYVPHQYVAGSESPFIVGTDGPDKNLFIALDNLIAAAECPRSLPSPSATAEVTRKAASAASSTTPCPASTPSLSKPKSCL